MLLFNHFQFRDSLDRHPLEIDWARMQLSIPTVPFAFPTLTIYDLSPRRRR